MRSEISTITRGSACYFYLRKIETDTFSFVLLEVIIWKVCSSFSKLFLVLLFFKLNRFVFPNQTKGLLKQSLIAQHHVSLTSSSWRCAGSALVRGEGDFSPAQQEEDRSTFRFKRCHHNLVGRSVGRSFVRLFVRSFGQCLKVCSEHIWWKGSISAQTWPGVTASFHGAQPLSPRSSGSGAHALVC